jgi:hypothetical protein
VNFDEEHLLPNNGAKTCCWLGINYAYESKFWDGEQFQTVTVPEHHSYHYDLNRCYIIEAVAADK